MNPPLPPVPAADSNDKLWCILCHLSAFLGVPFLLPLIVYLVKRTDSSVVAAHAGEVLNFHISLLLYSVCAIPLVFFLVGIPILIGIWLMGFICAIIAAIKTSEGGFYYYPLTIRLIS